MLDPFRIEGPAVISFSGGRTSAYMLRRYLDANGGGLPRDVFAVFANTGREMPQTLDFVQACADAWGVPVVWLEYCQRTGTPPQRWREVTHATASRNGEPFDALIEDKAGMLPANNPGLRFCTLEMKVLTIKRWMRARGLKEWTNAVGLRADEPRRVARANAPTDEPWETVTPLATIGIMRADVLAFWKAQPFDLGLEAYESNCDLCFMKGRAQVDRMLRNHPERAAWWIGHEERRGRRFRLLEPTYAVSLARVRATPLLPGFDESQEEGLPCGCTD